MNLTADDYDESDKRAGGRRLVMNYSIYSADRSTHLKIVVMALVAGIAVAGFGISARTFSDDGSTQTARVVKAGKPVVVTSSDMSTVR
jgi:L-asparaginase/Glu-tRNA(Gln) amidotransferase subunit D